MVVAVRSIRYSVFRMGAALSSEFLLRRLKYVFLLFVLLNTEYCLLNTALADSWQDLHQGDQTAQALFDQMNAKKQDSGSYPLYQGLPQESNYGSTELIGRPQAAAANDPASQMVMTSSDARPQIKIDPATDPLLTGAQHIAQNPLEVIGGAGTQVIEVQQGGKTEIVECEESGEDAEFICKSHLIVTIKTVLGPGKAESFSLGGPSVYSNYGYLLNSWPRVKRKHFVASIAVDLSTLKHFVSDQTKIPVNQIYAASAASVGDWVKVKHKKYTFASYKFAYGYQPLIKVPEFEWKDDCEQLEQRVDNGFCGYLSKVCSKGRETRVIDGVPITQDCWEYTMTYGCSYPAKDDCGPLRARGCAQITSACKQWVGAACVLYQQTYQCKDSPRTTFQIQGGNTPFCMDGHCRDQSWENNDELMSSVAQLSILKEMQGKLEGGFLFKGDDKRCSKYVLSFKDCCGAGKGWGNDMGLASCSADEKLLNKRRKAGLCHRVGTYCDKKVLGKCVKKKTSYCCFGSKLLKAFQEQGRAQIGMGWGEPKEPLCRGFTIEEIQRIDFSKLDLREVFEELMKNYNPGKMGDIGRQVGERLDIIKQGMVPNAKRQQPKQRGSGA